MSLSEEHVRRVGEVLHVLIDHGIAVLWMSTQMLHHTGLATPSGCLENQMMSAQGLPEFTDERIPELELLWWDDGSYMEVWLPKGWFGLAHRSRPPPNKIVAQLLCWITHNRDAETTGNQ
jgi:hypothetical protein